MIRRARPTDAARWYEIRNDPEALFWSGNKRPIPPEEHVRWWAKVHRSHAHYLAVAEGAEDFQVAGYGRFQKELQAEVSFGMADGARGKGYGGAMLRHLEIEARDQGVEALVAYVHPSNIASMRCFLRAGYVLGTSPAFTQLRKVLG